MKNAFTPRTAVIGCAQLKRARENNFMKRLSILAAGLLMGAAALSGMAHGQSDGWVTLLDSTKMGDWDEVGKSQLGDEGRRAHCRQARRQGPVLSRHQDAL
jgi:hypothetical protein